MVYLLITCFLYTIIMNTKKVSRPGRKSLNEFTWHEYVSVISALCTFTCNSDPYIAI